MPKPFANFLCSASCISRNSFCEKARSSSSCTKAWIEMKPTIANKIPQNKTTQKKKTTPNETSKRKHSLALLEPMLRPSQLLQRPPALKWAECQRRDEQAHHHWPHSATHEAEVDQRFGALLWPISYENNMMNNQKKKTIKATGNKNNSIKAITKNQNKKNQGK